MKKLNVTVYVQEDFGKDWVFSFMKFISLNNQGGCYRKINKISISNVFLRY